MIILFLKLFVGHCLCDFSGVQGDFLARAKNHRTPLPGIPWYQCLIAHATIQAGMVWFLTDSLALGLLELILHGVIDYLKNDGKFDFTVDQVLHVLCKVVYVFIILAHYQLFGSLLSRIALR